MIIGRDDDVYGGVSPAEEYFEIKNELYNNIYSLVVAWKCKCSSKGFKCRDMDVVEILLEHAHSIVEKY